VYYPVYIDSPGSIEVDASLLELPVGIREIAISEFLFRKNSGGHCKTGTSFRLSV